MWPDRLGGPLPRPVYPDRAGARSGPRGGGGPDDEDGPDGMDMGGGVRVKKVMGPDGQEILAAIKGLETGIKMLPSQLAAAIQESQPQEARPSAMEIILQDQIGRVATEQKGLVEEFSKLARAFQQNGMERDNERFDRLATSIEHITKKVADITTGAETESSKKLGFLTTEIKRLSRMVSNMAEQQAKARTPRERSEVSTAMASLTKSTEEIAQEPTTVSDGGNPTAPPYPAIMTNSGN